MKITVTKSGNNFGPYTPEELAKHLEEGSFEVNDLAWHEGIDDWVPISTIFDVEVVREQVPVKMTQAEETPSSSPPPQIVAPQSATGEPPQLVLTRKPLMMLGGGALVLFLMGGLVMWGMMAFLGKDGSPERQDPQLVMTSEGTSEDKENGSGEDKENGSGEDKENGSGEVGEPEKLSERVFVTEAVAPSDDPYSQVVKNYWESTYRERLKLIFRGEHYEQAFESNYGIGNLDNKGLTNYTKLEIQPSRLPNLREAAEAGWKTVKVETTWIDDDGKEASNYFTYILQERNGRIKIEWEAIYSGGETFYGWDQELHPERWEKNSSSVFAVNNRKYDEEVELVTLKLIENFPERVRGKTIRIQGQFRGLSDTYLDNIKGVTISSNGLTSRLNVTEKQKWLGFDIEERDSGELFYKCFALKEIFGDQFLNLKDDYNYGTPLDIIAEASTLDRSGGDVGLFCNSVAAYNIWTGEWEFTELD